ncbi:hypothetical protein Q8W17_17965 [Photobacterium damselae subsp. piscicida]|nr:hypothetical protein [Photobacterium damselae subsp. piscicida]
MTIPLLLRGFGIGLLNVSVSIAVLMYFTREEQLEGISCFYLFRTVGGLIGALFSAILFTSKVRKQLIR